MTELNQLEKLLDEKIGRVHDSIHYLKGTLEWIHEQTKKTNWRVTKLEWEVWKIKKEAIEVKTETDRQWEKIDMLSKRTVVMWSIIAIIASSIGLNIEEILNLFV